MRDRLYPSVYENDDEAFAIWQNEIAHGMRARFLDAATLLSYGYSVSALYRDSSLSY